MEQLLSPKIGHRKSENGHSCDFRTKAIVKKVDQLSGAD